MDSNWRKVLKDSKISFIEAESNNSQDRNLPGVFEISIPITDTLQIIPGEAEITAYGDKKLGQAVLQVHENRREITRAIEIHLWGSRTEKRPPPATSYDRRVAINRFPINFPPNLDVGFHTKRISCENRDYSDWIATYNITAVVPETTLYFLIGKDETTNFVSLLPGACFSVQEAHDILMPDLVRKAPCYKRQGEWFFIPVSARNSNALTRQMNEELTDFEGLERDSHHYACTLEYKGNMYAIGVVLDDRGNHKPLILSDWHRAIRNLEVVLPNNQRQSRSWD